MPKCDVSFPVPLPDDPHKWEGWNNYKSANFYERLCLDPRSNPSNELIEERCRELLRWWQKKLPLKNQPSNPLAQLLRAGLDESSRFLTEARVELLDPERRQLLDDEIAANEQAEALAEFQKYLLFATADGTLTSEEEKNLLRFGNERGLSKEQMIAEIGAELERSGAQRVQPPPPPPTGALQAHDGPAANPQEEFLRMLRLSGLDSFAMTDDQRDAFINMAESLGIDPGEAEDLVDLYLEEADEASQPAPVPEKIRIEPLRPEPREPVTAPAPAAHSQLNPALERVRYSNFKNSLGTDMLFIPSGEFTLGSEAADAAPNERPMAKVTVSRFYLSRYLVTNAAYEEFDSSHRRKRMPGAGDRHPVVHVSSLDAIKFCQWLSSRERKKYRFPPKRNGNTPPAEQTAGNFPGAITRIAAISPTSPIATLFLPGAIATWTTATRRPRRSARSRLAQAPSESKIWPATSGNGAPITTRPTRRRRRSIRAVRPRGHAEFIGAAVGNRASTVCARPRAIPTSRAFPATISASASRASANEWTAPRCRRRISRRRRRVSLQSDRLIVDLTD